MINNKINKISMDYTYVQLFLNDRVVLQSFSHNGLVVDEQQTKLEITKASTAT